MTCQNLGPWHSWLTPEACSFANGVWVRNPCILLQECISSRPKQGDSTYNEQFEQWVNENDLEIYNPGDESQCSQARVALGYEDPYLDDSQVRIFHLFRSAF